MHEFRRHDLFITLVFSLGLLLLLVFDTLLDMFTYADVTHPSRYWLAITGTLLDAVLFTAVFILLKIEIHKRREAHDRLLAANELKTEFLQIVAHDLRNPLNAILLHTLLPLSEAGEGMQRIRENAREMLALIDGILGRVALDEGRITLRPTTANLAEAVRKTVERNQPQAVRKRLKLVYLGSGDCTAKFDETRLRQAVDNLISNAIKFSPPGGAITVRVHCGKERARIEVADEGPGLSPDDLKRMFGRFQRLSAKPTAGEPSTGLGLANARHLVELHHGRIGAESPGPGQGSLFWIELERGSAKN